MDFVSFNFEIKYKYSSKRKEEPRVEFHMMISQRKEEISGWELKIEGKEESCVTR